MTLRTGGYLRDRYGECSELGIRFYTYSQSEHTKEVARQGRTLATW